MECPYSAVSSGYDRYLVWMVSAFIFYSQSLHIYKHEFLTSCAFIEKTSVGMRDTEDEATVSYVNFGLDGPDSAVDQVFDILKLRDSNKMETFDVKYALLMLGIDLPQVEFASFIPKLDPMNVGYVEKNIFRQAVSQKIVYVVSDAWLPRVDISFLLETYAIVLNNFLHRKSMISQITQSEFSTT